jgi:aryl-alcohol dehydrogenase-like predicted oxidoreductase
VKKLTAYAKERLDASIVHLALAWCLTNPNVSVSLVYLCLLFPLSFFFLTRGVLY